jgi:S-adenosylmethionine synthetase
METKAHLKVTAINVVCEMEKEAVETELMEILGIDHPDPSHPGYFQQRNAAAKRVLAKMTERERAKLNALVEERKTQGHPDHIRRE